MWGAAYGRNGVSGTASVPQSDGMHAAGRENGSQAAVLPPSMGITIDDRPALFIGGRGQNALSLGDWAERAGLRCIGQAELADVPGRLEYVIALDVLLIDVRGAHHMDDLHPLMAMIRTLRSDMGEFRLLVVSDLARLDLTVAQLDDPETVFLCEPEPHEIISLLVMTALTAGRATPSVALHDSTRDEEGARIERLSEEVRRLAATIEQLTISTTANHPLADTRLAHAAMRQMPMQRDGMARPRENRVHGSAARSGPPTYAEIRALLRARRMREQYLPGDLFADPAWDMILDLLAARLAGQRVSVSSLCIAASVPPTTALRWIRQLTDRGILTRIDDPEDGRRVFIDLTDDATEAALSWAQAVRRNGGLLSGAGAA